MNEKFRMRGRNKDGITLSSIIKPNKDSKITHGISRYRDAISLNTEKKTNSMKQDKKIKKLH